MRTKPFTILAILVLVFFTIACKPPKPTVTIIAPAHGAQLELARTITVQATATDEKGVLRVELWVDGTLTKTASAPTGKALPSFPASFSWTPTSPGSHTLEVRAYNVRGKASPPAAVIVNVIEAIVEATPTPQEWKIPSDKYVFIDHHIHEHGKSIVGYCMKLWIDFPTYRFDEKTGILIGEINFDINETLKVVYGSGASLSGDVGGGAATRLLGVYELPYERGHFKILKIDSDGTAYIEYKGVSIVLKSGEEWVNITSRIQSCPPRGIAKLTITDKIINYGILDKSKVENRWPPTVNETPTPVTPTPTPVETPTPFAVTKVTASVDPLSFTGACPKTFNFSAVITVNGPGTVAYRWERSDGATAPTQTITFAAAGSQSVTTSWKLGASYSGWQRVHILAPNEMVSNQANFTLACEVAPTPSCTTHSTGPATICGTCTFDLDEGVVSPPSADVDLWWQIVAPGERYLVPQNEALLAVFGVTPPSCYDCMRAPLSTAKISDEQIPIGTYVCVRTNEGRYAEFRVNDDDGYNLYIGYCTWDIE